MIQGVRDQGRRAVQDQDRLHRTAGDRARSQIRAEDLSARSTRYIKFY